MLHVQRCEELVARLWPLAIGEPPDLEAMDRLMRVLAHQARVTGLYVLDRSRLTITATSTGTGTHPKVTAVAEVESVLLELAARQVIDVTAVEDGDDNGQA